MWTNKDPTSVGRLAGKETLKQLIPGFEKEGKILPYRERINKERSDTKLAKNELAKALLEKSVEYYKIHFKKTIIKIDSNKTLDENLDLLTEEQLFEIQDILDFCHKPKDFNRFDVPRLIVSVQDHSPMRFIIGKIEKRIPGFKERIELLRLETQETEIEKRKGELRVKISKAQTDFKTKPKKEIKNKPKFICEFCSKECSTPAGLASHLRTKHKPKEVDGIEPEETIT